MNLRRTLSAALALSVSFAPCHLHAQSAGAQPPVLPAPGGNAAAIAAQAVAGAATPSAAPADSPAAGATPANAPSATPAIAPAIAPPSAPPSPPPSAPPSAPAVAPASASTAAPVAAPTTAETPAVIPPTPAAGGLAARPALAPQGLGIGRSDVVGSDATDAKPMALSAGLYKCELSRNVTIRTVAADGKSLVLAWGGRDHAFSAVEARTGALRFENVAEGMVWLVIIGKAMLLDTRKGKQLANECRH